MVDKRNSLAISLFCFALALFVAIHAFGQPYNGAYPDPTASGGGGSGDFADPYTPPTGTFTVDGILDVTGAGITTEGEMTATGDITSSGDIIGDSVTDGTATLTGGALELGGSITFDADNTYSIGNGTNDPYRVYASDRFIIGNAGIFSNNVKCSAGSFDNIRNFAGGGPPQIPYGTEYTNIQTITAATDTLVAGDHIVLIDSSSNAVTVTLPAASGNTGKWYVIKAIDVTNTCTVDGSGAETIDGSTTYVFSAQYESITIICDGSNWHIF